MNFNEDNDRVKMLNELLSEQNRSSQNGVEPMKREESKINQETNDDILMELDDAISDDNSYSAGTTADFKEDYGDTLESPIESTHVEDAEDLEKTRVIPDNLSIVDEIRENADAHSAEDVQKVCEMMGVDFDKEFPELKQDEVSEPEVEDGGKQLVKKPSNDIANGFISGFLLSFVTGAIGGVWLNFIISHIS